MKHLILLLCLSICIGLDAQVSAFYLGHNKMKFDTKSSKPLDYFEASELVNGKYYRVLKTDHLLNESEINSLFSKGIEILEYIPNLHYVVSVKSDYKVTENDRNLFVGIYQLLKPYKLSEQLLFKKACIQENGKSKIVLKYFKNIDPEFIKSYLNFSSLPVDRFYASNQIIYLALDDYKLEELASLPWVQFIDCESEIGIPEDREGQSLHRVNMIRANLKEGLKLSGAGVKVMVRDDGSVGPHIDFTGRIHQDIINELGDHGDGVSGILTGAGNYDPQIEGMAPGSELFVINYQPDFLDKTLSYHQNEGVVITNTSYSNGCNLGYSIEAQVVDKQLFENPSLLHVFSAGNSNGLDCGYGAGNQWGNITGGHKIGKNALTVANLNLESQLEISSSRGPTKDGRLKPEIAARGTNELSTSPGNGTIVFGGTSAAAPGVAGVCALLYEAYKNLHNNENPESALIKAAILNTATDIGTKGPDYQFGFGVIDAYRAFKLIQEQRYQKSTISQAEVQEFKYNIPAGSPLAKIMLYWAEPEASLLAAKALINDLDLEITDPNGTILKPWVLNPSPNATTLAAGASIGIDTLNNVEQISIPFPVPGLYTVRITGKFLPSNKVAYYLLHEVENQMLRLTFPIGGEKFNITELTQVHYTSYGSDSIKIFLSTDAGKNWTILGTQPPDSRLKTIYIPNNVSSDSCLIELLQGTNKVSSGYFTITNGVQGLKIVKYCPNEIGLAWNPSTLDSFLIYQLGEKYMAPLITTDRSSISLTNENPKMKKWFSIAGYDNTVLCRREQAIGTPDTFLGCNFKKDLELFFSEKNRTDFLSCNDLSLLPEFKVINRTNQLITGFTIFAQSKTASVSQQFNNEVEPYDTVTVEFTNGMIIPGFGSQPLKAWLELNGDENPYNDTIEVVIKIQELIDKTGSYPMIEDFSGSSLPSNWIQKNGLDASRWNVASVKNKNGQNSNAIFFANQNPNFRTVPLQLISKTADLTNAVQPYLYFDFAHHNFSSNIYHDSIRIRVKQVCGTEQKETLLLSGISTELNTVDTTSNQNWLPTDTSWYWMAYDLSPYKGSKVIVEFEIVRGQGNRTFLDNVEIREKMAETGKSDINIFPTPGCYTKQITFNDSSEIIGKNYLWDIDAGGNPRYFYGKGPFKSRYTILGKKRIVLKIKSDIYNDAIVIKELPLTPAPSVAYNFQILNFRTVSFTNNSTNAVSQLWDFGDGTNSTEMNPVHTFDSAKIYKVKLTVSNVCGNYNVSKNVDLLATSVTGLTNDSKVIMYPNPFDENIILESNDVIVGYKIFTSDGKLLTEKNAVNLKEISVSTKNVPSGIYSVQIITKNYSVNKTAEKYNIR